MEGLFLAFLLSRQPKKAGKGLAGLKAKGKIAIVLDDWGYHQDNLAVMDELRYPLTMSILPNLAYSQSLMQGFRKRGYEVILHLPMEPYEKYHLEKNTIMVSMDEEKIKDILKRDLENIFYAKGVSNHMGSRATGDGRVMSIALSELKKRRLYFLDSFVSQNTICLDLAKSMKIRYARRDVFLDNKLEPEYIRSQIEKLKKKAALYGGSIGIGHDRKVTLEVLKEIMPKIEREGYRFVFVSELVK